MSEAAPQSPAPPAESQLVIEAIDEAIVPLLAAPDDSPLFSGCTGAHREHIRKARQAILSLTAAGHGAKAIAKLLSISPQSVRAVRSTEWAQRELDPLKQSLGRRYLAVADQLLDSALEDLDKIPPQVRLLASAQAADKGQLLTGAPTSRVEVVNPETPDSFAEWMQSVIDVSPVAPGSGDAYKGSEPRQVRALSEGAGEGADGAQPDYQSEAKR